MLGVRRILKHFIAIRLEVVVGVRKRDRPTILVKFPKILQLKYPPFPPFLTFKPLRNTPQNPTFMGLTH
jgi:hypothetical protein